MAALGAATVTNDNRYGGRRLYEAGRRRNAVQIVFGDGASTYPVGGIPLPARGQFGMVRFLETLELNSPSPNDGFMYKFDTVNNTIRIYGAGGSAGAAGVEMTAASVPALGTTLYGIAQGW